MHDNGAGRGATHRRRHGAGPAIVTALLALAGAPARAEEGAGPATLTVRGQASVAQAPDLARMTVAVITRGPSLDAAVRDHAGRVIAAKAVLARLAAAGVTVDQGSFDLGEQPAPVASEGRRAEPSFQAESRFDLTLRNLDRIDATVGEIAASSLFDVEATRFGVTDGAGATDRARRAAMADARHQAEVYADAGGLRLDAIQRIADAEAAAPDGAYALPLRGARSAKVGVTPPRTLDFSAAVTVTWRVASR